MVLLTGCAGFIGYHLASLLLARGDRVVGIDNLNEYYDPSLKHARLERLRPHKDFTFYRADLGDIVLLEEIFHKHAPDRVCHLAAQAGVRYSLTHPFTYEKSNGEGFLHIIELSKRANVKNFVFASSSSVYGANTKLPFCESDPVDQPVSLYAATKRANELTAYCYHHLFELPCSGLRFFTVYGPWGRPDMALFLFTKAILEGKPIDVYNSGKMSRNFTYIDDIVEGIVRVLDCPRPYELYNIGNSRAESLMDFISQIEHATGTKAHCNFLPMQPGDVVATVADIQKIRRLGFEPRTNIDQGIQSFVSWFRQHYRM